VQIASLSGEHRVATLTSTNAVLQEARQKIEQKLPRKHHKMLQQRIQCNAHPQKLHKDIKNETLKTLTKKINSCKTLNT